MSIITNLTKFEVFERLQILKAYIDEKKLSVYDKRPYGTIKKIFDLMDNNNTVTIVVYANWSIKIEGAECVIMQDILGIFYEKKFSADKHYNAANMFSGIK